MIQDLGMDRAAEVLRCPVARSRGKGKLVLGIVRLCEKDPMGFDRMPLHSFPSDPHTHAPMMSWLLVHSSTDASNHQTRPALGHGEVRQKAWCPALRFRPTWHIFETDGIGGLHWCFYRAEPLPKYLPPAAKGHRQARRKALRPEL